MNFVLDLLVFLGVLSVLVLVHELGHFLAARRAGVKVEEFGFGFPPRILGKKIGETLFSINAIPIGGFVRLHGEDGQVKEEQNRAFYYKSRLSRTSVIVAGVVMNLLLAIVAFSALSWYFGIPQETGQVQISGILKNSPAEEVGLQEEDIVLSVDGKTISTTESFIEYVNQKKGKEVVLSIKRQEQELAVTVVPRKDPPEGEGALGVAVSSSKFVHPPLIQRPYLALKEGINQMFYWLNMTVGALVGIFQQASQGHAPEGVTGPVGIFEIISNVRKEGIIPLVTLIGILSVNLGVLNIFPFPALDGGRLLFVIVESIFGRRVLPTFERYAHAAGMVILILLIILISIQDIGRIINGGTLIPQP